MKAIFERTINIAVIGMSKNPEKSAYSIPAYMKSVGYNVIPVNPAAKEIDGVKCYATLAEVLEHIDLVSVFRPSEDCSEVARQVIERHNAKGDVSTLWLQSGITNSDAEQMAEEAGIDFIEDKCFFIEHKYSYHK